MKVGRIALAFAVLGGCAGALSARWPAEGPPLVGFTEAHREQQHVAEKKLKDTVSAQSLSDLHRTLTAHPHMAGTPGGKAVADAIAEKLRSFGLNVEMDQHWVYLSYPKRVRVSLFSPQRAEIAVTEPAMKEDPAGSDPQLTPGFVAYSASGRVRGRVVYANYGLPADYEALQAAGVNVKGAIVLARYGRVHRAVKVFNAEQRGARGVVIYSDPADDGSAKGEVWPAGPWRHAQFIQRGNAKYSWFYHGDPLTPGCANGPGCPPRRPSDAPTLPKIPVVAISAEAADPILRALKGAAVPANFQGKLPFPYFTGPGPVDIELDVQMENGPRPIYNVIGRIEGSIEPDRWVILGTHHEAWTYGGVDPGSSCAALLELARALGEMQKTGWKPRRTIVFGFWDAEEYGLIGSTEFAERYAKELREKAVAYINSDLYMAGPLRAGGTASLRDFVAEVARDVASPAMASSLLRVWWQNAFGKLSAEERTRQATTFNVDLDPLGSGADFVPFQAHLGLPALSLEFGGESYGSYGAYHSNYDTRWFMEKFGDPGWRYGPALVEVLGNAAMRLATADVLPYRYSHLGEKLKEYVQRIEETNRGSDGKPRIALNLAPLNLGVRQFLTAAQEVEGTADRLLSSGQVDAAKLREINTLLAKVERSFAVEDPPKMQTGKEPRWYRHTVYGWNIYALYAGQTLPALNRAVETSDGAAFAQEHARLMVALHTATEELMAVRKLLE